MNPHTYKPERIYTLSLSQESWNRNKHKWINDFIDRNAYPSRTRTRAWWQEMELIITLKGANLLGSWPSGTW